MARKVIASAVCISLFFILSAVQIFLLHTQLFNGPIFAAIRSIKNSGEEDDAFIHLDEITTDMFGYYFPDSFNYLVMDKDKGPYTNYRIFGKNFVLSRNISSVLEHRRKAWLVVRERTDYTNVALGWFES